MRKIILGIVLMLSLVELFSADPFATGSYDFMRHNWGATENQVRSADDYMDFNKYDIDDEYYYIVTGYEWLGEELWLSYHFKNGGLVSAQLTDHSGWENPQKFWDAYVRFHEAFIGAYGEPADPNSGKPIWLTIEGKENYADTPERWGEAIANRSMYSESTWETDNTRISVSIQARNGIVYFFTIHDMK